MGIVDNKNEIVLLYFTIRWSLYEKNIYFFIIGFLCELLAKITFLQEAPKMEIANLLWYKE